MSFPRYEKYKDSGVEWLVEVPEHWEVRRLKHVAEVFPSNVDKHTKEGETPVRLCNYTDVYYNEIISDDLDLMAASATDAQIEKFELRAGDTIITKDSETADDIAVPAYVPDDLPGVICGYHLSMIRPRGGLAGAFVKRLFDSRYIKSSVEVRANGLTRVGLGQYALDNLEVPYPPYHEQSAIAAFLDHETAKIDALVDEQRRLIELLKEKRQAVIAHAVTKGLNPDAPMKDSGVEWLGEVPEHWEVAKLGYYARVQPGFAFPSSGFTVNEEDTRLLRGVNVGVGCIKWDETVFWNRKEDDGLDAFELHAGDIVLGMDRPLISEGMRVAKVTNDDLPCLLLQRVAAVHCMRDLNPDFAIALLASDLFVAHFSPETTGVSVPHISPDQINGYTIPLPPVEEQNQIVSWMNTTRLRLDELVLQAEQATAVLQERRTALISAAVTGKIDVRNHAPKSQTSPGLA